MIVDTSVLVAIVRDEPEAEGLLQVMGRDAVLRMSPGNLLETYMVIDGARKPGLSMKLDVLIGELGLGIDSVTEAHILIARDAFRRYGKGSGHPAQLNFGDCFAYALARFLDEPLLFIGNDFGQTDLAPAV